MRDDRALVRRFLAGHRAAQQRQLQLIAERGALPAEAVAECLEALDALERGGAWPGPRDPVQQREIDAVRRRWAKLKRGYRIGRAR